jgi:site-specific recombinase XerD
VVVAEAEFETLALAFDSSLAGKSPKTRATYATGLASFRQFVAARGDVAAWSPSHIRPTLLEDYYAWLVRQHGRERRATVLTYVAAVRSFLRYLARRDLLPQGVTYEQMRANLQEAVGRASYRTPRIDRRLPLLVTHVQALSLPDPKERRGARRLEVLRDKALILTLFCTGMRREEVARLDRQDVENGVADRALITGKGEKERVVFFDDTTLDAIRAYLEARGDTYAPLFLRHDNRRGQTPGPGGNRWRLSPQSVWSVVKQYAKEVGVPASTHHFRHAKASTLLNRGASLSEVQDILGHASPETTKRIYAHYQVQHLREAFDRFSASAEELVAELPKAYAPQPSD